MVEHNQSSYYNNGYKFNGKELDEATGMYYYGARYYDPRISIFISVDPLAEQTMEPYLYTGNNPIMFTDPTGMSKEGGEHDPPKKGNQKGDKVLHIKYKGADKSIYENDDNVLAKGYRMFKSMRQKTDEFLSGGFQFDDDDSTPKGDQSLRKQPKAGQQVERLNVSGFMQAGSFAKSADGTGFKYNDSSLDLEKSAKITNSLLTGYNTGQNIGERELKTNVLPYQYENIKNSDGGLETTRIQSIRKDSAVKVKDFIQVRLKINKQSAKNYYDKQREGSFFQPK